MYRFLKLDEVFKLIPDTSIRGEHKPIIAVLDTNIATTHPELKDRLWKPASCLDYRGFSFAGGCTNGGFGMDTPVKIETTFEISGQLLWRKNYCKIGNKDDLNLSQSECVEKGGEWIMITLPEGVKASDPVNEGTVKIQIFTKARSYFTIEKTLQTTIGGDFIEKFDLELMENDKDQRIPVSEILKNNNLVVVIAFSKLLTSY